MGDKEGVREGGHLCWAGQKRVGSLKIGVDLGDRVAYNNEALTVSGLRADKNERQREILGRTKILLGNFFIVVFFS